MKIKYDIYNTFYLILSNIFYFLSPIKIKDIYKIIHVLLRNNLIEFLK